MAQNQLLKRYLEAGMQFTAMTQERAEAIVRDLVRAGEVQAETAQNAVNDLLERSRRNTERLVEQIRAEVQRQVSAAEKRTKDVVAVLQDQLDELRAQMPIGAKPAKKATKKKAAAKKAPAKKTAAKKAPAKKKAAAKKAVAKKA